MKNFILLGQVEECQHCEGSGFQINEIGFVRACPYCATDRKTYENRYGSDPADMIESFVDADKKIAVAIKKKDKERGYLLLKDGTKIILNQ